MRRSTFALSLALLILASQSQIIETTTYDSDRAYKLPTPYPPPSDCHDYDNTCCYPKCTYGFTC